MRDEVSQKIPIDGSKFIRSMIYIDAEMDIRYTRREVSIAIDK